MEFLKACAGILFIFLAAGAAFSSENVLTSPAESLNVELSANEPFPVIKTKNWFCAGSNDSDKKSVDALIHNIKRLSDGPPLLSNEQLKNEDAALSKLMEGDVLLEMADAFIKNKEQDAQSFFHFQNADHFLSLLKSPSPWKKETITLYGCFSPEALKKLKETSLETARGFLDGKIVSLKENDLPEQRHIIISVARKKDMAQTGKDFGDAPDARYEDAEKAKTCGYPSMMESGGVRHNDISRAWLGETVTPEADSLQPNADADDGWTGGEAAVTNFNWDGKLYLNVLVDLTGEDGCRAWEHSSEWVARNMEVAVKPGETKTFPLGVSPHPGSFMRITLSGVPVGEYNGRGVFDIGETEDYTTPFQSQPLGGEEKIPDLPPDLIPNPEGDLVPQADPVLIPYKPRTGHVCQTPCGYDGSVWGICCEDKCRACFAQSPACNALKEANSIHNGDLAKSISDLNALYDSYQKSKGTPAGDALKKQWQEKKKEVDGIVKKKEKFEEEAEKAREETLKKCRALASEGCADVLEQGQYWENAFNAKPSVACKVVNETAQKASMNPTYKKWEDILSDFNQSALAKHTELRKKGARSDIKYFLWYIGRSVTPWALLTREDGVTKKETEIDTGKKIIKTENGIAALAASGPAKDGCCAWSRITPVRTTNYKVVIKGVQVEYDFTVRHVDLQRAAKFILKTPLKTIPGFGPLLLANTLYEVGKHIDEVSGAVSQMNEMHRKLAYEILKQELARNGISGTAESLMDAYKQNTTFQIEMLEPGKYIAGEYAVRVKGKAFFPVEICQVPEDSSILIKKEQLGEFPCSATPADVQKFLSQGITKGCASGESADEPDGEAEETTAEVLQVIPMEGNNPFDAVDPLKTESGDASSQQALSATMDGNWSVTCSALSADAATIQELMGQPFPSSATLLIDGAQTGFTLSNLPPASVNGAAQDGAAFNASLVSNDMTGAVSANGHQFTVSATLLWWFNDPSPGQHTINVQWIIKADTGAQATWACNGSKSP